MTARMLCVVLGVAGVGWPPHEGRLRAQQVSSPAAATAGHAPEAPAGRGPAAKGPAGEGSGTASADVEEPVLHVGGKVLPPRVIRSGDVDIPEERDKRLPLSFQVYLWVERDGSVSHVEVRRSGDPGMNERVLAAVRQYRFLPATADGVPVRVDMYMDVNISSF